MIMKHAYLIMVHEMKDGLFKLLETLDHKDNDIYIHIDKKCKDADTAHIRESVKKSYLEVCSKYKIYWGHTSIMDCEVALLKRAVTRKHAYYHLLSGVDLPLRGQEEIHAFFEKSQKEFVHFGPDEFQRDIASRYQVYHFFMKGLGRTRENPRYNLLETYSLAIQRRLKVKRSREPMYGGANWFSITEGFAAHLLAVWPRCKRHFMFTQNSDELFLQTILKQSKFMPAAEEKSLSSCCANSRYVDWTRGNPYTFRLEDYETLMRSGCMFARKFDPAVDAGIVDKICSECRKTK